MEQPRTCGNCSRANCRRVGLEPFCARWSNGSEQSPVVPLITFVDGLPVVTGYCAKPTNEEVAADLAPLLPEACPGRGILHSSKDRGVTDYAFPPHAVFAVTGAALREHFTTALVMGVGNRQEAAGDPTRNRCVLMGEQVAE